MAILLLGLSVILLSVSGFGAPPVLHSWFIEHFTIGTSALPEGVKVEVIPRTAYEFPGEFLAITNVSDTFLYVRAVEPPPATGPTGPEFAPPPVQLRSGGIPAFRVASGKAYVWDVISKEPPWQLGWAPLYEYRSSDALRLYIYRDTLTAEDLAHFRYAIAKFELRNQFDGGGQRPANVRVPSPQYITVPMDYGAEEKILPLTISYTLNEHYPARGDYAPEWVSFAVLVRPILVAGMLIVGLIWLGFKLFTSVRTRASGDR